MDRFERLLASYDYDFPESSIALEPSTPRDAAKLLIYDPAAKKMDFDIFRNLAGHLPAKSCLVFNETKVVPARLIGRKSTGGRARLLYVRTLGPRLFEALSDRPVSAGNEVSVGTARLRCESVQGGRYVFRILKGPSPLALCERFGITPLPPYLKATPLSERDARKKYQTVFARQRGSVAAPTASLHFTPQLMKALRAAGHEIVFVTLHVNLGTFLPLKPEQAAKGELHEEQYEISPRAAATIAKARKAGHQVIAVGTTVVRALESAAAELSLRAPLPMSGAKQSRTPLPLTKLSGTTRLFIRPGYRFRVVDGMITNFHVPKSSLLMLVAALVGRTELLGLYRRAIRVGFKLFSFGDGMLLLPRQVTRRS